MAGEGEREVTTSLLCQQLLPGPFSAICTNQWKWIWFPPGCGSRAANLSPQLPLRPGSWAHYCRHEGGRRRRQVNVVSEENVWWWQHSLQGDYYPWFIILIYCRRRCFLACSLSAAATLPLFTPSHLHLLHLLSSQTLFLPLFFTSFLSSLSCFSKSQRPNCSFLHP